MPSFFWQWMLVGFIATSLAIYQGNVTLSDPDAIGVVRVQIMDFEGDTFGSGVVLGNGKCVITAAHLVKGWGINDVKVVENKKEGNKIIQTPNLIPVSKINIHPLWRGTSNREDDPSAYDFAVVELQSPSTLDASPWAISTTDGEYHDVNLYGWGGISQAPVQYPTDLRWAIDKNRDLNYWDQCKKWRKFNGAICIMNNQLNCGGDSGGPAVTLKHVVGVGSGSNRNCGFQTAGLLAGLFGPKQYSFLNDHAVKCGFKFGNPLTAKDEEVLARYEI